MNSFEKNINPEDTSSVMGNMLSQKTPEQVMLDISAEQHLANLEYAYDEKSISLLEEILALEKYIDAKDKLDEEKYVLDAAPLKSTSQVGALDDMRRILEKYEEAITSFEKDGAPEEMVKKAEEKLVELRTIVDAISDIREIAKQKATEN